MSSHTSQRLSLDSTPKCWCGHEEESHLVRWLKNEGESKEVELGSVYPDVQCMACIEDQLGSKRIAAGHIGAMAKALAAKRPEAAVVLAITELSETILRRRNEGADVTEIEGLVKRQQAMIREAGDLIALIQKTPKGES